MQFSFDFPADTGILTEVGEVAAEAGLMAGFDVGEIGDIQLALDEACTNTIVHGLKKDPDKTFRIEINCNIGEMEILIYEYGEPFDPDQTAIPDIDAPLEDRKVGGLGVYFVRKLMDDVEYSISEDGLKTLRMIKRNKKYTQ